MTDESGGKCCDMCDGDNHDLYCPKWKSCDDAEVMKLWRECGLPEYFLGNGGTNYKLVEFAKRIRGESNA